MKILSLSGFIPEHIVDTVRFIQYSGSQRISHYCGYVADYISQIKDDASVDGAVFPRSCDSCRVLSDYLSDCNKFMHQLNIPARQDDAAVRFFASGIQKYKEAIEQHYGITITDIEERTKLINKRNTKISAIYENIANFSYSDYLKRIHDMLTKPIGEQSVILPKQSVGEGKPVFLVGSFLSDLSVIETLEKVGLSVVGDNLTESKRLFSAPSVNASDDIYYSIATSILKNRLSPTQSNFAEILKLDYEEIKRKDIRGVIFITQKYCEPYDYLFTCYKRMLDDCKIPALRLILSDTKNNKRADMAIESFADIL